MAKQVELAISPREVTGKATKRLRKVGVIPANIFGRGEPSQSVQVERTAFEDLRRHHNATGVISLKSADAKKGQTALIRHVQHDPRTGRVLHIDFFRVSLSDRITAKIPLHLDGVAPGVKVEGGVLLHLVDALEVECTASDIVESLELDISSMENIGDIIHAKDVPLPANYTLITDADEAVVKVMPPRIEKVEEVAEALAEAAPAEAAPAASAETKE